MSKGNRVVAQSTGSETIQEVRPKLRRFVRPLRLVRKQPMGFVSVIILVCMVGLALLGPALAPSDPLEQRPELTYAAPLSEYLLGGDKFGRDILSRIISGARISLLVGFAATAFGTCAGSVVGMTSGYFEGKFDLIIQRLVDTLEAFPPLILAMILVVALGPSLPSVIVAVGATSIPLASRVIRSVTLQVKTLDYITSVRAAGAQTARILIWHVLPQTLAPMIIVASVRVGHAIITEATLGFLGLGVPPPTATWGQMLAQSMEALYVAPWVAIFPGVVLCLTVFAVNVAGDAVRDEIDPSFRTR